VVLREVIHQAETSSPMSGSGSDNRTRYILSLVLLVVVAVIALFESPFAASDLAIAPDSVEYATSAWRVVHEGRYAITINGTAYPPRYPPGFALIALAPAYLFSGQDPGYGIYGILFWSVIGVLAAFVIGRRIGGAPGGLMAGGSVLLLPHYRHYSQVIMSDATCTAVTLVLLLAYLRLTAAPRTWKGWLGAGVLAALVASIRPTGLSATLPFLLWAIRVTPRRKSLSSGLIFLLPVLLLGACQMLYNHRAFGTALRSGYQFWCPVPYDYTHLTFGFSDLPVNAEAVWRSGLLILIIAATILYLALRRSAFPTQAELAAPRDCLHFIFLSAAPLILFHLFYFFADPRFFLPVTGPLAALVGGMLGAFLHRVSNRITVVAAASSWPSNWLDRRPNRPGATPLICSTTRCRKGLS
jgi:4-amino-4-deoxy-L-arabinose transferase-like glycosyltransferase